VNEEELRTRLAEGSDATREFYKELYRFTGRFSSLNPLGIFILGGAFTFFGSSPTILRHG
jgi:hypothetical protein